MFENNYGRQISPISPIERNLRLGEVDWGSQAINSVSCLYSVLHHLRPQPLLRPFRGSNPGLLVHVRQSLYCWATPQSLGSSFCGSCCSSTKDQLVSVGLDRTAGLHGHTTLLDMVKFFTIRLIHSEVLNNPPPLVFSAGFKYNIYASLCPICSVFLFSFGLGTFTGSVLSLCHARAVTDSLKSPLPVSPGWSLFAHVGSKLWARPSLPPDFVWPVS